MTLAAIVAPRLLLYGVGNVGRQDDGVGVRVIERLERRGVREGVALEAGYQLAPEDALSLSQFDAVIFIDATVEAGAPVPYRLQRVHPARDVALTTHDLSMGSVLAVCASLYGTTPEAWAIEIPAYEFEINGELSGRTAQHLEHVVSDLLAIAGDSRGPETRRRV